MTCMENCNCTICIENKTDIIEFRKWLSTKRQAGYDGPLYRHPFVDPTKRERDHS